MIPGEVAVEISGGHAAAAAQEGFQPHVAAVDGVEMEVTAAAFAGFMVERFVGDAERSGAGREKRGAVGAQERVRLDGGFEPGRDGSGRGFGQDAGERRTAAVRYLDSRGTMIDTCSFARPRLLATPPRSLALRSSFRAPLQLVGT